MAEVPGGVGKTFGMAKIRMRAPKARSPMAMKISATETRSRSPSSAIASKISERRPPRLRGVTSSSTSSAFVSSSFIRAP
ncbi:hypothetical protein D3C87_1792790 [compost metagenome]